MSNFIDQLNEYQQNAVTCMNGPVLVIAGAGSGKTRVLTYRVAYMLQQGIDPFRILALTFTNKAAREMKERIITLIGNSEARSVWMGTFHSIFARILRSEGHLLGYPSNYTIYDTDDSKSLLKSIIKEQNLDPKTYAPGFVHHRISSAKNNLVSAEEYNANTEIADQDKASGKPMLGNLFVLYQNRLKKASAMDFDDLLFNTNILFRDFTEVLYKYQHKFSYILVDEYQDTNYAQYLILKKLAAAHENISVVGDDAQSIYAFRGASIRNILGFTNDYPDAQVFKLEQNYRSTQIILNAANSVIVKNKQQINKELWTHNEAGTKIRLLRASTDNEEGMLVANSIFENKMNHQLPNNAFAILYRTNAQSRAMEEALRKLNIPYRIYGGLSFYKRKEIKDVLAYFRLTVNNNDEESLYRIINYPARGIGKTTLEKAIVLAEQNKVSVWQIFSVPTLYPLGVHAGIQQKINQFITMIRSFGAQLNIKNAFELGRLIVTSSGIVPCLREEETPESVDRVGNIEELLNAIKDFCENTEPELVDAGVIEESTKSLGLFMQDVALLTDSDTEDTEDNNRVSLMTIHTAKGLEFQYVHIVGLEENLFPSIQSLNNREDIEEERRLFYVALTRAMKNVTLSYSESRYRWGDLIFCEPSRFIDEIDPQYLDLPVKKHLPVDRIRFKTPDKSKDILEKKITLPGKNFKSLKSVKNSPAADMDQNFAAVDEIQVGMTVAHDRFGQGKVLSIEGNGPNRKTTVFFQTVGQKQLLLQFAKLRIVN